MLPHALLGLVTASCHSILLLLAHSPGICTDEAFSCIAEACGHAQDKTCFHCFSEVGKCALPPTLSSCLVKASGGMRSTPGTPLDLLAPLAKKASVPEFLGILAIRKKLLADHYPRALKPNPSVLVKRTYLLSLELHFEGQTSVFLHI